MNYLRSASRPARISLPKSFEVSRLPCSSLTDLPCREGNRELDLGGRAYRFRQCRTAASGTKPTTVPVSATLRRFPRFGFERNQDSGRRVF